MAGRGAEWLEAASWSLELNGSAKARREACECFRTSDPRRNGLRTGFLLGNTIVMNSYLTGQCKTCKHDVRFAASGP